MAEGTQRPFPAVIGGVVIAITLIVTLAWAAGATPGPTAGTPTTADPVQGRSGMVVSASGYASDVGARVLEDGGNAVDAAVATGLALAVTHPSAGNIGGGGFMVIRFPDGRATTIDFREKAPLAARPEMFLDESGEYSYEIHHGSHTAVGVPGTVAGFALAHERYGSEAWSDLVEPAVTLADQGFELTESLAGSFRGMRRFFEKYPASLAKFTLDGRPYRTGEVFRQSDLARSLERIRDRGHDGFYAGETAHLIEQEMERGGGLITAEDLARYEAVEREPIRGTYRGYDVISMPPPSSGGVALVQMLNILEGYDLASMGQNSPDYVHHVSEAMRRAYLDRARHLADQDFAEIPIGRLTDKAYAAELRASISADRAGISDSIQVRMAYESPETTHYSVVDKDGLAVSVTYTLEQGYGSKIVVTGGGFLLNNEMGDFNAQPGVTNSGGLIGTAPNLARPEQRMLSSMTPTIVAKDGELVAVIGSPGGRTIINSVLEVFLGIADFGLNIQEAVNASRFHHQWLPDRIRMEEDGLSAEQVTVLEAMGHTVDVRGRQGRTHCIMIDPGTGMRWGAADLRGTDAKASGY